MCFSILPTRQFTSRLSDKNATLELVHLFNRRQWQPDHPSRQSQWDDIVDQSTVLIQQSLCEVRQQLLVAHSSIHIPPRPPDSFCSDFSHRTPSLRHIDLTSNTVIKTFTLTAPYTYIHTDSKSSNILPSFHNRQVPYVTNISTHTYRVMPVLRNLSLLPSARHQIYNIFLLIQSHIHQHLGSHTSTHQRFL